MHMLRKALTVATLLWGASATAQVVVSDPTSTALEIKMLATNIEHGFQLGEQLTQLKQNVQLVREGVSLARDAYAGINYFQHFDAQQFLQAGETYFLAGSGTADALNLAANIEQNGLNGGYFSPAVLGSASNLYNDVERRAAAIQAQGHLYDPKAALTLSAELDAVVHNLDYQQGAARTVEPSTSAQGLLAYDALQADPSLLALVVHQRAESEQQARTAMKLYLESLGASPGKAEQLAASATTLSAVELGRLNDKQAQSLNLQLLERTEKSVASAQTRKENDLVWQQIVTGVGATYGRGAPVPPEPSMGDR